ncbi:Protein NLP6 [Camellia lanceoleosa]|uniref:Protein NLP6 n=1 Tax=Camellia lanceoleosa TaxID=1840588 RepID=A0ACC0G843_9ERIC|nr:Protein NLP6 [Camellia lanceoleosa]
MWEEEEEQIWECTRLDSVWERLRNQPIYSPPPSPSSGKVFLISPQLYFSLPPPLTPQLHFSPPPSTSDMSPYLDFSPPPPPPPQPRRRFSPIRFLFQEYVIEVDWEVVCQLQFIYGGPSPHCIIFICVAVLELLTTLDAAIDTYQSTKEKIELRLQSNPNTQHARSSPRLIASTVIGEIWQCHSSRPLKTNLEDTLRDFCSTVEFALLYLIILQRWRRLKLKSDGLRSMCLTIELAKKPDDFKMVSIWSCLSVVKISRKISIRLLQVLPSVQLQQTLQIVIVEEKMTKLLSRSGEFISQDCSLVEERSAEITMEVDATNNGAHGVKAYQNFPIVSYSEKKNTRDKLKRNYKSISVLTREDLEQHFGSSREDVANSFGVSVSTMKRIFRKHGISRWPFQPERKKERLMEVISPSMYKKHDSRLQCIQTPLHARSSPRTIALLDGGEMVQLDSSKQQSLVEFDVTTNSAHLVRASQSCSTISHSDETNSRETLKRKCTMRVYLVLRISNNILVVNWTMLLRPLVLAYPQ